MSTETQKQEPIKVIKLDYPVEFGDKTIDVLNIMRRPKAKHLIGLNMQAMQAGDVCKLLGKISDMSTPEVQEIDLQDFHKVGEALKAFLPKSLGDGNPT